MRNYKQAYEELRLIIQQEPDSRGAHDALDLVLQGLYLCKLELPRTGSKLQSRQILDLQLLTYNFSTC
jgi:hypothetical protein